MNEQKLRIYSIVFFMGAISSIMVSMNSVLVNYTGLALGSLTVHVVGFVPALIFYLLYDRQLTSNWVSVYKKEKILMTAGFLGALSVIGSTYCINIIGVFIGTMAMTAGQFILSFVIDRKGYFGFEKVKLSPLRLISLIAIAIGIIMISL